ncbi:rubrerythrin [Nostoc sp. FACHB-87]|uniref:rubrerythrin family protein n=1 Tax=Nostocales TaxID=1161 RepID=UPI0016897AE6|nr:MULTISPECIES: rubrerythrin family protein [Nostocales]MBD2455732.1 rubrerythrin [Nostoc sp. FACHB-87]MBD2477363.1 rubrerythrin [Anabaena sp. FACHB-83]MBD2491726.1 rubrerythrin [Aulosira sp. FACHB-615]
MTNIKSSKTYENLKNAFAIAYLENKFYLDFARVADEEGHPDIAGIYKDTAEKKISHALGHLDYVKSVGAPLTNLPTGRTEDNLKFAVDEETSNYTELYPYFAKIAREEGFNDIAEWFETVAKATRSNAGRFQKGLDSLNF